MTYLVTGLTPAKTDAARAFRAHEIFDTEEEARTFAENQLKLGAKEVSVWSQVATPKLEQIVSWEESVHHG